MSPQLLFNAVIIVALVGYLGYRQMQWRAVEPSRIWRLPIILAIIGLGILVNTVRAVSALDIAVLVFELALSIGIGALMGRIATFRPLTADDRTRDAGAQWASRTGWIGFALWVVLLAIRIGLDVVASMMGSHLATSTGVILLVIAANRLGRGLILTARVQKLAPVRA